MFRKSKLNLAIVAALALFVAAPVANADPARVPDEGVPAYIKAGVISTPDAATIAGLRMDAAAEHYGATPDQATIAGLRMQAAAQHYGATDEATIAAVRLEAAAAHYGVNTTDYGVNTTDYSRADFGKPNPATVAGLRMQAAAEHYGALGDLRSPDALDAAQPPVVQTHAPVVAAGSADQTTLSPAGADFPWAGLLVGLGLAGVAGLLGLVVTRGSFPRPLSR